MGTTNCKGCATGKSGEGNGYGNINEASACTTCAKGKYTAYTAETSCTSCPKGTYLDSTGNDAESDCKECVRGKYLQYTGSDEEADCTTCPSGQGTKKTGSTSSSDCGACSGYMCGSWYGCTANSCCGYGTDYKDCEYTDYRGVNCPDKTESGTCGRVCGYWGRSCGFLNCDGDGGCSNGWYEGSCYGAPNYCEGADEKSWCYRNCYRI